MADDRIQREPCGCVYNAATDIYERFCEEHDPAAEALRKLRETDVGRVAAQLDHLHDLLKAASADLARPKPLTGLALIAAERRRQVEEEGWTPEHDGQWQSKELVAAAACYLLHERLRFLAGLTDILWPKQLWPDTWPLKWWKPGSYAHNLVLAGALIAAELDRLIREGGRGGE